LAKSSINLFLKIT